MNHPVNPVRKPIRVLARFIALAFAIVGCLAEYLIRAAFGKWRASRRDVLHRWSARLLRWLNVEVECGGQAPPNGLIVSNHLSYLDILVFSALAPCTFVAKHEVKSWPGVGWIATLSGAIYIDRSRRSETHTVQPQLRNRLATGERVVLFPEGTSSDGKEILPFRPSLLQQAVADQTRITAACISYGLDHGDPSVDVCYYADMVLLPHAARLFAKTGVRAYVRFGETARTFNSRKEAARGLFEEVKSLKDQPAAAISRAATAVV